MPNRLSHSAAQTLSTCARKYKLHYIERIREFNTSAALLFGSAIDLAINSLLLTKDIEQAIAQFKSSWSEAKIHRDEEPTSLPTSSRILYSKADFDKDILIEEDFSSFNFIFCVNLTRAQILNLHSDILEEKLQIGWNNLAETRAKQFNYINWCSLYRKGLVMIDSYNLKVVPKIKEVLAVQKEIDLVDAENNKITGFIDLVARMDDGKVYVLDLKTSSIEYDSDAAERSQQLTLYYSAVKDEYKVDKVGFIVLRKRLFKNKEKSCSLCKNNGTGNRCKTCDVMLDGIRCNGEWIETVKPEADINFIYGNISPFVEKLVMENFETLNAKINSNIFEANLQACKMPYGYCEYYALCHKGSMDGLIKGEKSVK